MRNDCSIHLGNERPGVSSLSPGKIRFASPSTACGGYFSPSAVKCNIEGPWDDRDLGLGKTGTVTEVQSVLSLSWLNMWDQTAGTQGHGLSLCLCGSWYMVSPCYTQREGQVSDIAISCTV